MTTRRTLTWPVPGTPAEILRRMADPEVARRRAQAAPELRARVTALAADTPDGAALVMEVTAEMPQSWVPNRIAAAMPTPPRIVRRETWRLSDDDDGDGEGGSDGTAQADVTVRLEGVPATTMSVSADLRPSGSASSVLTYEVRLDVAIPLAGAAIERAVIEHVCRSYEKEAAVIQSP